MGYNYNPNRQPTARGSANLRSAERRDTTTTNTLPDMSEKEIADMMEERERKRKEEERQKKLAEAEAIRKKEEERLAYLERQREIKKEKMMAEAKSIAPDYRRKYDAGDPQSFNEAKKAADETYMQFLYDKANSITDKWTEEDYRLLVEEEFVREKVSPNRYKTVRKYPKGYDEFLKIKENIDYGVLDFTSEKDHKKLIKPPSIRGYGKYQSWIDPSNPLRQAVDAQSAVMKEWLDEANIPIVIPYSELDGFNRPDPMRGEGIYLNTGTGAHIDWDSGRLKRMQSYRTISDDGGFGEYSTAFIRPDPDYGAFGKVLTVVGTLTGNPIMRNIGVLAQGGDWKDIAKGYIAGQVTAPIVESTFASLGVDADLLGVDPDAFSDSMMDVQTTMLEGGSGSDALLKEFGGDAVKQLGSSLDIDIDLPESEFLSTIEDVLKPVVDVVKEGGRILDDTLLQPTKEIVQGITEPVVDVAQEGIDVLQQAGRAVDETVLQPVKEGVQAVTEPVVDVIDDIIDAVDSPLGDLLGAGGDLIGGMLSGQQPQTISRTPVENIFDKELFKFDTEIKSTQEMLSPMMNSRRYG